MRGRDYFTKYNYLFRVLQIMSLLIPKFIFKLLWSISTVSESKGALLIRYLYVKKYTAKCGNNIYIGSFVTLKNEKELNLGSNISIHAYTYIDSFGGIIIKDNTSIANHCSLIAFNHTYNDYDTPIKYNAVESESICIENDVWIGNGVRILAGTKIGSRTIVAAGAVVNSNFEGKSILGGIPAKIIKEI